MESAVVDYFADYLSRQTQECMPIDQLEPVVGNLSIQQKNLVKKCGKFGKFLLKHPEAFAVIDDYVYLVHGHKEARAAKEKSKVLSESVQSIIKDLKSSGLCMVCSDDLEIYAFGTCFHPICYRCSTKLRVLCRDVKCTVCRVELSNVMYTTNLAPVSVSDMSKAKLIDEPYGISFQDESVKEAYSKLLEHNCPECKNNFKAFESLSQHLRMKHQKHYCTICLRHNQDFTFERKAYSVVELKRHEEVGDGTSAMRGHPKCEFCNNRYLDNDELYRHLKREHFSCHLCVEAENTFYAALDDLWDHFGELHFYCKHPECIRDPSRVFENEHDLKNHLHHDHGGKFPASYTSYSQMASSCATNGRPNRLQQQFTADSDFLANDDSEHKEFLGEVISVISFYGFIAIDGINSFEESIYFNAGALGLNNLEDLSFHIKAGDRVYVRAEQNPGHRTKWRAETVEIVDDNFKLANQQQQSTTQQQQQSQPSTSKQPPNQSDSEWKIVSKSKPATNAQLSSKKNPLELGINGTQKSDIPWEGFAFVLASTNSKYGFLRPETVPPTQQDRNVYFDMWAYARAIGVHTNQCADVDLKKKFTIGEKVFYRLQDQSTNAKKKTCKYKADLIMKMESYLQHKKEMTNKSASSSASNQQQAEASTSRTTKPSTDTIRSGEVVTSKQQPTAVVKPSAPTTMNAGTSKINPPPAIKPTTTKVNVALTIGDQTSSSSSSVVNATTIMNGFPHQQQAVQQQTVQQQTVQQQTVQQQHVAQPPKPGPIAPPTSQHNKHQHDTSTYDHFLQRDREQPPLPHTTMNNFASFQHQLDIPTSSLSSLSSHKLLEAAGDNNLVASSGNDSKDHQNNNNKIFTIDDQFKSFIASLCYFSYEELLFDIELELSVLDGISGILFLTFEINKEVTIFAKRMNRDGSVGRPVIIPLERHTGINCEAITDLMRNKKATSISDTYYFLPGSNHHLTVDNHVKDKVYKATLHFAE